MDKEKTRTCENPKNGVKSLRERRVDIRQRGSGADRAAQRNGSGRWQCLACVMALACWRRTRHGAGAPAPGALAAARPCPSTPVF